MAYTSIPVATRLSSLAVLIVTLGSLAACGGAATPGATTAPPTSASSPGNESSSPAANGSGGGAAATVKPVPVESNPPGDIPDNLAFVAYTNRPGRYSFTHPEGWAQTGRGAGVRFTDKLNGVAVDSRRADAAPTVASAQAMEVPRLQRSVPAFELRDISAASLPAGQGVHIIYRRNSDPDQVTGKVYRDEVEEYLVFQAGRLVRMDLFGPVGADNVDAYRTMSQSLSIR